MELLRSIKVNGHLVEEFLVDGNGLLVYIDGEWVTRTYREAIKRAEEK